MSVKDIILIPGTVLELKLADKVDIARPHNHRLYSYRHETLLIASIVVSILLWVLVAIIIGIVIR